MLSVQIKLQGVLKLLLLFFSYNVSLYIFENFFNMNFFFYLSVFYSNENLHDLFRAVSLWNSSTGSPVLAILLFSILNQVFLKKFFIDKSLEKKYYIFVFLIFCLVYLLNDPSFLNTFYLDIHLKDSPIILKDWLFVIHPPILYAGYLLFVVSKRERSWSLKKKNWVLKLVWGLTTIGIFLGSLWAFNELGWGSWWFWDPVEVFSLTFWLNITMLIHFLSLCRKKPNLVSKTKLLSFTELFVSMHLLIGILGIRSDFLETVHAFVSQYKFINLFHLILLVSSFIVFLFIIKSLIYLLTENKGGRLFSLKESILIKLVILLLIYAQSLCLLPHIGDVVHLLSMVNKSLDFSFVFPDFNFAANTFTYNFLTQLVTLASCLLLLSPAKGALERSLVQIPKKLGMLCLIGFYMFDKMSLYLFIISIVLLNGLSFNSLFYQKASEIYHNFMILLSVGLLFSSHWFYEVDINSISYSFYQLRELHFYSITEHVALDLQRWFLYIKQSISGSDKYFFLIYDNPSQQILTKLISLFSFPDETQVYFKINMFVKTIKLIYIKLLNNLIFVFSFGFLTISLFLIKRE